MLAIGVIRRGMRTPIGLLGSACRPSHHDGLLAEALRLIGTTDKTALVHAAETSQASTMFAAAAQQAFRIGAAVGLGRLDDSSVIRVYDQCDASFDQPRLSCILAWRKYWLIAVSSAVGCSLRNSMTFGSPFTAPPPTKKH